VSSLLPPNATPLERNLAAAGAAIAEIPIPIRDIGDSATCPTAVLPFLAWERSVDRWDPDWPEATKRAVIDAAFLVHQRKGTVGAIRRAIEPLGYRVRLVPWYEMDPVGRRGTFAIQVEVGERGVAEDLHEEIARLIDDAKPLARHLTALTMQLETRGHLRIGGAPILGDIITVHPNLSHAVEVRGGLRHGGAFHVIDTLTVHPGPTSPVEVSGRLAQGAAFHVTDTVTVTQLSL